MANNSMSLKVLLQLQTDAFNRQMKKVQGSLKSFASTLGKIGAGFGASFALSSVIGGLKKTATELSIAKATLENVSVSTMDKNGKIIADSFEKNYQFVKALANEYNQDLNALTINFAQFHAAAKNTNLTMAQQEHIFKALTKAAATYHMSASRTQDMMNAITQMMSKGNVAAEELRRQLGNSLPGAYQIFAKSLGMSTKDFEKAMRAGKISAEESLPKFAAMLDQITASANFDSLQNQMNRLKNNMTQLTETLNIESTLKGGYNVINSVFDWINKDATQTRSVLMGLGIALGSLFTFKGIKNTGKGYFSKIADDIDRAQNRASSLSAEIEKLKKANEGIVNGLDNNPRLRPLYNYDEKTGRYSAKDRLFDSFISFDDDEVNDQMKDFREVEKQTAKINSNLDKIKKNEDEIKNLQISISDNNEKLQRNTSSFSKTLQGGIKAIFSTLKAALMSLGIEAIISLVIGGLVKIISFNRQINKQLKEAKNITTDRKKAAMDVANGISQEVAEIEKYRRIATDATKSEQARQDAVDHLNVMLGRTGKELFDIKSEYDEINAAVAKWTTNLKAAAMQQFYLNQWAERTAELNTLMSQKQELEGRLAGMKKMPIIGPNGQGYGERYVNMGKALRLEQELSVVNERLNSLLGYIPKSGEEPDTSNDYGEIRKLEKLIDDFAEEIVKNSISINRTDTELDPAVKQMEKALDKYKDKAEGLNNELEKGMITPKEYERRLDKLNETTAESILATEDFKKVLKALPKVYKDQINAILESVGEAKIKDLYDKDKEQQIVDDFDENFRKSANSVIDADHDLLKAIENIPKTKAPDQRDRFFDYKKNPEEIWGEQYDIEADYLDALKEEKQRYEDLKKTAQGLTDVQKKRLEELEWLVIQAGQKAQSTAGKMMAAQWLEDVREAEKQLKDEVFNAVESVGSGMQSLVDSFKSFQEIANDTDMSVFEKMISLGNEMIKTFGTLVQVLEDIEAAKKAIDNLQKMTSPEQLEMVKKMIGMEENLTNAKMAEAAVEKAVGDNAVESASKVVGAKAAEITASEMAAGAASNEAIAGAAASSAHIPIVGPAIALAAMGIIAAALASRMKKYANGGIIDYGTYSGDNTLARVNKGEMILNSAEQATLFKAIKTGNLGSGGNVEFKIRGADLYGALNNYNRIKRG